MRRHFLIGSCLAVALSTAGCSDQSTGPVTPAASVGTQFDPGAVLAGGSGLERGAHAVPSSVRLSDRYIVDAIDRAINPGDYVCSPVNTPVVAWFLGEVNETIAQEPAIFDVLYNQLLADLIPTYEALYLETDVRPQYFGYDGEYTQAIVKVAKDARRFWDIRSDDIQLIGMHGSMLLDVERTAATYEFAFGVPPAVALQFATIVRDALLQSTTLDRGNHPLFSFNAFAISASDGSIPDKIVMGDGILAGYESLGFGNVAPQGIFMHEFAHHIQYENGYFDTDEHATTGSAAEQTRYTELMADAMSAYFLTHKRGAALNRKRVEQFLEVFFQIGDCSFASGGHHGTPTQRMRAAQWGFELAFSAQKQGHILTSDEVHDRFVAFYPTLIAPDAP